MNAPNSLTIVENGSATVSVNRTNVTGTGTINATSSNSGQIQVTSCFAIRQRHRGRVVHGNRQEAVRLSHVRVVRLHIQDR